VFVVSILSKVTVLQFLHQMFIMCPPCCWTKHS